LIKRILFVIDNLKIGGAEKVFVDIANLANYKIEFDVFLVTDFEGDTFKLPENIRIIELHRKNKYSLFKIFQVKNILSEYEIIHIHMRHTFHYLSIIKFLFGLKNKYILHDHYGKINLDKKPPFLMYKLFKPNFYIGVCSELSKWAVEVWKIKAENVFCFQNLPNMDFFKKFQNLKQVKNGKLIMVGNIKSIKNQLFALNLANSINMKIDFVGRNQDDEYYNLIKENLEDNKILEDCSNVSSILGKYTMGIFTSKSESGPLVILEYLLCGLPFIAYNTGGISDILSKYFPDFFIDSFEEKLWIQKISDFRLNPPVIDREMVLNIINTEFNREEYLNGLLRIYEYRK
jgi:glycosyltransferase involved in cell wall biosynthesis